MSLNLPYSVRRGEQLGLKVTVFNYLDVDINNVRDFVYSFAVISVSVCFAFRCLSNWKRTEIFFLCHTIF